MTIKITEEVHKIFGSPGTGKTTYLLNIVDKELTNGTSSRRMGYFSFTRKAATEARDRAITKFPQLNAKTDFPFFRTLHSLAFYCLGIKTESIMQAEHFKEFAEQAGIQLSLMTEDHIVKADNPILNEINIARIRGIDLHDHYNQSNMSIEWHHFEFVERTYRHYKTANSLFDFTDLLEMIVAAPTYMPFLDVLIIDEAQDLSLLQWRMVDLLSQRSKRVYIAGDDDQAIFVWAGADVKSFLSAAGTVTVLKQSHRIPSSVHKLADTVVQRIHERQPKNWSSRDFEGIVKTYRRFEDVNINDQEWLILASTNYMLNPIHEWLKSNGVLFERGGVPSLAPTIVSAVMEWERLRKGQAIDGRSVRNIYKYLDTSGVARGNKLFKTGQETELYTIDVLREKHGLLTDAIWHEALTKIAEDKRTYLLSVLRRGTKLSDVRRIRLSTIHGAKGGEADHVLLFMDLSPKFAKEYSRDADNVHRLFYVGITRAKEGLHLVLPRFTDKGFRL